ncbi:nitrous oxide reductase family maturation protein NosD [Magnetospirillum sp. 64-120]|uniref:nitrous oxide reductase family maturation protein NosD n=1 Tax=Magnetospirillum sp. 64-120 TaxID=1895778 RepID=UPI000AB618BA|nr:nitrous oxide reductase family maturation protein NosD [Magnetospirillum sp. 64-120]
MLTNVVMAAQTSSWRRRAFVAGAALSVTLVVMGMAAAGPTPQPPPQSAEVIQSLIDAAADGASIVVPPGHYVGHVQVNKTISLDGAGQVTIDAGGTGTVMVVKANNATVKGFHLTGTGSDHNSEDSGIQVRGNNNVVKDNIIDDALFGIDLQQSYFNIVRRNHITSKPLELGLRGDSIRLWYSDDNSIEENVVKDSRDFVLWYSKRNHVRGNHASGGRYGMHFMFAADNLVEDNVFTNNSVGISAMYDSGDTIRRNVISHSVGATGTCISMKEASAITIENNEIIYCANGIFLDVSPFQPDTVNVITGNRIAFNDIAISFLNDWHGNEFRSNTLTSNMTEVAVFGGGSAKKNLWDGNVWDSYEGFDRDGDGVGDTPHRVLNYAGRVWMDVPNTRFFKGAPVLEVLDFLDRLAPFSEPELMLEDEHPRLAQKMEKKP